MGNVVLYSNGCPKCNILEAKLKAKKINYDKTSDMEFLEREGFQSLPVLKSDDKYLTFLAANAWVNDQPVPLNNTEFQEAK